MRQRWARAIDNNTGYEVAKPLMTRAFKVLHKRGYITRQAFQWRQFDAWKRIVRQLDKRGVAEADRRFAFFTMPAELDFQRYGVVYLHWASPKPTEIVEILKSVGLDVEFTGHDDDLIKVGKFIETNGAHTISMEAKRADVG